MYSKNFCDNYIITEICNDNTTEKYKKKHLKDILKKKRFTYDIIENELINAVKKEYYELAILFLQNDANINTYNINIIFTSTTLIPITNYEMIYYNRLYFERSGWSQKSIQEHLGNDLWTRMIVVESTRWIELKYKL